MEIKEIKKIESEIASYESKINGVRRKISALNKKKTLLLKEHLLDFLKVGDEYTFIPNPGKFNLIYRMPYLSENQPFRIKKLGTKLVTMERDLNWSRAAGENWFSCGMLGYKNFCDYIYHYTDEGKKIIKRKDLLDELLT